MKHREFLEEARKRMAEAVNADRDNRARALDDLQKLTGEGQWPDKIRSERESAGKPCLTINRLPQFVRQVTGDIRRMNPAMNVSAADNDATKEIAEIYEGIIRQIEYASDASAIYEGAAEAAAACSIGCFRVLTEYESDTSFDQEIRIEPIRNPLAVYFDPAAQKPTRADAAYVFITEQVSRDEFAEMYPDAIAIDAEHDGITDGMEHWHESDAVTIAEYIYREETERTLIMLKDGQTGFKDDLVVDVSDDMIERERRVMVPTYKWCKISGKDVLEGPKELPCSMLPVFAVTGEEWNIGTEVYRSSVIRYAKDPQQMYNFFRSASAEVVALQPKAPYIGTLNQFKGLEAHWAAANSANQAFLPYNPDDRAPGPPQRQQPPVASQGLVQESIAAAEDMKATTGIYDAALGNRSNEASGVAIRQRQMESDVSTSIYTDNMAKAIAACGRCIVSMIPRVYDTERVLRIVGKDEKESLVQVNGIQQDINGPVPVNDLRIGKYAVRVSVGPNYSTRRQETAEGMLEFIRVVPGAAQFIGDLVAKAMDWPDADQIAERLEKALPPNMRDQDGLSPEEQQAAMAQAQKQAQQEQMMQAAQVIQLRKEAAEGKEAEADAVKAGYEAEAQRLELLMQSGALDAMVRRAVAQQVAEMAMQPPYAG